MKINMQYGASLRKAAMKGDNGIWLALKMSAAGGSASMRLWPFNETEAA